MILKAWNPQVQSWYLIHICKYIYYSFKYLELLQTSSKILIRWANEIWNLLTLNPKDFQGLPQSVPLSSHDLVPEWVCWNAARHPGHHIPQKNHSTNKITGWLDGPRHTNSVFLCKILTLFFKISITVWACPIEDSSFPSLFKCQ